MLKWMMFVCCLWTTNIFAQYPGYKLLDHTGGFRQQFVTVSQTINSVRSDFVQEKNLSMLSDKIVSRGKFWFKRENKVRMEYDQPSYYLVVINGNMIRTRDGQKENKVSAKSNKMFEQVNKMMIDCVQGTILDNQNFSSRVFENAQNYLLELTPSVKSLQSIFKNICLVVDKKDMSVSKLQMTEQSGDFTDIHFLHRQMNVSIPDDVFSVN